MPELPDIAAYRTALDGRVVGETLLRIRLRNPFVLRTVHSAPASTEGRRVVKLCRLGKRIVLSFRTAFWERVCDGRYRDGAFFRSAEHPFASYWTQLPVRSELVVAWAGGPKATALSGLSQNDLIERARDGFGAFGERCGGRGKHAAVALGGVFVAHVRRIGDLAGPDPT